MSKVTLLKQYRLCKSCLRRHIGTGKSREPCYICRGLMHNVNTIAKNIVAAIKDYEFETFLIGAILSTPLYEREDAMRARLKIRGRESIKNHLTRELGIQIARLVRKKVNYTTPDVRITLLIDKDNSVNIEAISKPLMLAGFYVKKSRGLPQKEVKCHSCTGSGCNGCNYSGLSRCESVEGIIAKQLLRITGGTAPKFTWIGSEDESSLVLGSGRPFYVRVFNPKKRNMKPTAIKGNGIMARLYPISNQPETQPRFTVKTRIHIKCENALIKKDLKRLKSIPKSSVRFENKSKMAVKRIYSTRVRQIASNQFTLTIIADGGLMIKQFVGGEEYMKPNVSEILGDKCGCVTFDILDVQLQ